MSKGSLSVNVAAPACGFAAQPESPPIVAGYHLIWTAYGWWLPNDPRGSSSHEIRIETITPLGEHHLGRKKTPPKSSELRDFYDKAASTLTHELLTFSDEDIALIGKAIAEVIRDHRYTCYACAIMSEHVHLLIRKHRDSGETMIERCQAASRTALIQAGSRSEDHPVWGGPGWKVFLNTQADMERIVKYIGDNPVKSGRPRQSWEFVQPYDGWLPGNPYARRRAAKPQAGRSTRKS